MKADLGIGNEEKNKTIKYQLEHRKTRQKFE
jgi:hypothetical protein